MPQITITLHADVIDSISMYYKYNDRDRYIDTVRDTPLDIGDYIKRLESQSMIDFLPEETKEDFVRRMLVEHIGSIYRNAKQHEVVTTAKEAVEKDIKNAIILM